MALILRTLYPRSLALFPDLVGQILPEAIYAETMAAAHGVCLEVIAILAANGAHETGYDLSLRRALKVLAQPGLFQQFLCPFHVRLNNLFAVPSAKAEQDRRRLRRQTKDVGNLMDLLVLLPLDIRRAQHPEIHLERFLRLLDNVLVVREAGVEVLLKFYQGSASSLQQNQRQIKGGEDIPSPKLSSSLSCSSKNPPWLDASDIKSSSESMLAAAVVAGVARSVSLLDDDDDTRCSLSATSLRSMVETAVLWLSSSSIAASTAFLFLVLGGVVEGGLDRGKPRFRAREKKKGTRLLRKLEQSSECSITKQSVERKGTGSSNDDR